jgi:hypothetical protein
MTSSSLAEQTSRYIHALVPPPALCSCLFITGKRQGFLNLLPQKYSFYPRILFPGMQNRTKYTRLRDMFFFMAYYSDEEIISIQNIHLKLPLKRRTFPQVAANVIAQSYHTVLQLTRFNLLGLAVHPGEIDPLTFQQKI